MCPSSTNHLFEPLGQYRKILVTGPQRSGTRIYARMVAHDLGYHYIDEHEFNVSHWWILLRLLDEKVVVQCPGLCHCIQAFSADDTLVVMMHRRIEDILASRARIGWNSNAIELAKYGQLPSSKSSAEVNYEAWDEQREEIMHWLEVEYESLAGHPLWIPKDRRRNFAPDQWK